MPRAALLPGAALLLSACDAPPRAPALSQAKLDTLSAACGIPAAAISLAGDTVTFDPEKDISYDQGACVLKELRSRLPSARIAYGKDGPIQAEVSEK